VVEGPDRPALVAKWPYLRRIETNATRTCFHHTDRETGRTCTRCDRPACSECLHDAPVGSHCWECIRAARPPTQERIRRWNATQGLLATKVLIAINAVVFLLTSTQQGGGAANLEQRLALFGPAVANGEWYRIVTAGFLHFGLIHIGFNMLLLYQFGSVLEPALGRVRFVALYTAALVAGSFGALLLSPNAFTGGASGAVFGLVGAVAIGMHRRGVSVWQSGVGGLLVVNLVLTFAIPNISVGGHLGGLAAGALVGAVMLEVRPSASGRQAWWLGLGVAVAVIVLAFVGALWVAGR
jgi:membrane associated rhomboid family serine protease